MRLQTPPYSVILWNPNGIDAAIAKAAPTLTVIQPPGIVCHDDITHMTAHGPEMNAKVHALVPEATIWWESEGDAGPSDAHEMLRRRRAWADAAVASGVGTIVHDIERRATSGDAGWRPQDLRDALDFIHDDHPTLVQVFFVYDQPTLHTAFPFTSITPCDAYGPDIYGAGLTGEYQREHDHVASWSIARAQSLVTGAPRFPYVPAAGISAIETCWIADAYDMVLFWVLGCATVDDSMAMDLEGQRACKILSALAARTFTGVGRVSEFQRSAGLKIDGKAGPLTRNALGVP